MLRGGFNHRALVGEVILVGKGIGIENGIGLRTGEEIVMEIMKEFMSIHMIWWIGMVTRREFSKVTKGEIGVGIVVGLRTEGAKKQREKIG